MGFVIRQAEMKDIEEILRIETDAWPNGLRAQEDMFKSRISVFPQGTLVAEVDGRIEAVVVAVRVNFNPEELSLSWSEATDNGYLSKVYDPQGETIYGVDLSVSRYASIRYLGLYLLSAITKMAIRENVKRCALGGRIPRFARYCQKHGIDFAEKDRQEKEEIASAYIRSKTKTGRPLDPEIAFYQKLDFKLWGQSVGLRIVKPLIGYINDPESLNTGVLLVWRNPFYNWPFKKFWAWLFGLIIKMETKK